MGSKKVEGEQDVSIKLTDSKFTILVSNSSSASYVTPILYKLCKDDRKKIFTEHGVHVPTDPSDSELTFTREHGSRTITMVCVQTNNSASLVNISNKLHDVPKKTERVKQAMYHVVDKTNAFLKPSDL